MKGLGLISRVLEHHLIYSTQLLKLWLDYLKVWEISNTMLYVCIYVCVMHTQYTYDLKQSIQKWKLQKSKEKQKQIKEETSKQQKKMEMLLCKQPLSTSSWVIKLHRSERGHPRHCLTGLGLDSPIGPLTFWAQIFLQIIIIGNQLTQL